MLENCSRVSIQGEGRRCVVPVSRGRYSRVELLFFMFMNT